jgi:hypothetical protein
MDKNAQANKTKTRTAMQVALSLPNAVINQENTCLVVQCHEQGEGRCGGGGWIVVVVVFISGKGLAEGLEEGVSTLCIQSITYYHQSLPPHDNLHYTAIWPGHMTSRQSVIHYPTCLLPCVRALNGKRIKQPTD